MTRDADLQTARSQSELITCEALNSENARLHDELLNMRAKFYCSQRVADQAIKERDRLATLAGQLAEQIARTDEVDTFPRLHDRTRADKAIRPRGAA